MCPGSRGRRSRTRQNNRLFQVNFFSWLLKPRILARFFIAAVLLSSLGLLLTFLISDGQKLAAKAVLASADVERSIGPSSSALLIGSSFKYSGSAGCEDFRYLVFGRDGSETVRVRIEMKDHKVGNKNVRSRKILELIEGAGIDFNVACGRKPEA